MSWKRTIRDSVCLFKRKRESEKDDESFYCIGLSQAGETSSLIDQLQVDQAESAAENIPDLPWETRHGGIPGHPLRSLRLSVSELSVSDSGILDPLTTEVHAQASRSSSSPASYIFMRSNAIQPLRSVQGLRIGEKLRVVGEGNRLKSKEIRAGYLFVNVGEGNRLKLRKICAGYLFENRLMNEGERNRLKLREICAGYLFEKRSSEDEKELELVLVPLDDDSSALADDSSTLADEPSIFSDASSILTAASSIFIQEDPNPNQLEEDDDGLTETAEYYLIEDLINDVEDFVDSSLSPLSEDDLSEDDSSSVKSLGKWTNNNLEETSKTETQVEEQGVPAEVERSPSPVPSSVSSIPSFASSFVASSVSSFAPSFVGSFVASSTPSFVPSSDHSSVPSPIPSPVLSLEFETMRPMTNSQLLLRKETRRAILLTERKVQKKMDSERAARE